MWFSPNINYLSKTFFADIWCREGISCCIWASSYQLYGFFIIGCWLHVATETRYSFPEILFLGNTGPEVFHFKNWFYCSPLFNCLGCFLYYFKYSMNPKYYSNIPVAFGWENSSFQNKTNLKTSVVTDQNFNSHNISYVCQHKFKFRKITTFIT